MRLSDGVVVLRSPRPGDAAAIVAARDDASLRWLGTGSDEPAPFFCIERDGALSGWVDFDTDREWLRAGEVNVGYSLFPAARGHGAAVRAVKLLVHHLARDGAQHTATALIDLDNHASLAVVRRAGFCRQNDRQPNSFWTRAVPPRSYTDGVLTIRRPRVDDLDHDLEAKDDEQIDWLWLPGQREAWSAMTVAAQRDHARRGLEANHGAFGYGPKWTFAVDTVDQSYVAYIDCDLANEHVPRGEANISYSAHPAHRGQGFVTRAVHLVVQFLRDNTGAREAHLIVDRANEASRRVAGAAGAAEVERWVDAPTGRILIRHVLVV